VTHDEHSLNRYIHAPNREIRVVGSLMIFVLAGGFAMLYPSVQKAVIERFGPNFPSFTLVAELLVLVGLFVAYLWRKSCQVERLVREILEGRERTLKLEDGFSRARSVAQASGQLHVDEDAAASLVKVLQCVIEALHASRGVLWRQRGDQRPLEREAVFPSSPKAPDPLDLAFEDEIAGKVVATGKMIRVDERSDLSKLGIEVERPRRYAKSLVAVPLLVDHKAVGALLLCDATLEPSAAGDAQAHPREMLEICVGFAAGALRNLRKFQTVARRNDELNRARNLLSLHQRELAEIDAVATMARVARSLAHGLSGPLTAIAGFADIIVTAKPDALTLKGARDGMRREVNALKKRLRNVVDFTQSWRRQYGSVDLNQVAETAVALQAESMRAREITVRFEPHAGLPFTVADPARLRQVFLSVLGFVRNTLSSERGPHDVRVRTLADGGRLIAHVEFRGKNGVKEIAAPLLDPNVEVTTLVRERSIDLPVAVAIVRDHQGDLRVEMLEGDVTRIVIDLPVQSEAPALPTQAADAEGGRNFESMLSQIFSENAGAVMRQGVPRPAAPVVRPRPVTVAPNATVTPMADEPALVPVGTPAPPAPADFSAVELPDDPSAVPPSEPEPIIPNAAPEGAGLDALFHANEMWKGDSKPVKVDPQVAARRAASRRSLLDEAQVEGALRLFDEITVDSEEPPPEEPAS
jgi:GAF domain-containing protein